MATQITITIRDVQDKPDIKAVDLNGEIDESNLVDLQGSLDPFLEKEDVTTVILNLKDLSYINSKVIGYLASYYSQLSQKNKKIIFAEANPSIMDILSLVGLTTIVEHYASEQEAINSCLI